MKNSAKSSDRQAFAGKDRVRQSRRSVLLANRVAGLFITLGGLCTIVAVFLVCVFLVWVVIPLFLPGSLPLEHTSRIDSAPASPGTRVIYLAVDEYLNIAWAATSDGRILSYRLDSGELLSNDPMIEGTPPTAAAFSIRDGRLALGFADGSIRLGRISFETNFLSEDTLPDDLKQLQAGEVAGFDEGIVLLTPEKQFRHQRLRVELNDPVKTKSETEIVHIDLSVSSRGTVFAALSKDAKLHVAQVTERKNLLTDEITTRLREGTFSVDLPKGELPEYLMLGGLGDTVYLTWNDGFLQRYDTRNLNQLSLVEERDLVEEPEERITALAFLIGKTSLVSGDSLGRVRVWFATKPDDAKTADGIELAMGHELPVGPAAVTHVAPSPRSRMLAVTYEGGAVRLFHVTSEQQVAESAAAEDTGTIQAVTISPKDDAIIALVSAGTAGAELAAWSIEAPHPDVSLASILRPVWYEGYNEPQNVWQSSSGTDDFEAKYGLVPLIFGTIKATFYSMLFGAPLALLAAIYTSEFLHPRAKAKIKPTIEVMASLPSVVLGFLAAIIFAPIVEDVVPEMLALFVTLPMTYLLGAQLWQLLPTAVAIRARCYRMIAMVAMLPLAFLFAWQLGGPLERWFFAGNIKSWLDGQIGTGLGAWMFICLPVATLLVVWMMGALVTPRVTRWAGAWPRTSFALLDLVKWIAGCVAIFLLAYAASYLLDIFGWDPRGTFVDTYVQRNALVVGFIMGFAIIPIIYTISDDALSAVPESLRAASLGAGATQWQTAVRVVIPTAMSGLFSAMMIGLGRAVGETMIVLMAAGNTPVMDWNIFNGFRTLSANIAVELPEAVIDSTHYRMLFLAALALFVMTFVVNTVAEVIRLRFRKRAFQL